MTTTRRTTDYTHDEDGRLLREVVTTTSLESTRNPWAQPIDRDELKAVIVSAGDAPAEIADAVVAWLAHV